MGILAKYSTEQKEDRVIMFHKGNDNVTLYLRTTEPPYTIGKVCFFKSESAAIDFKAKQITVSYYFRQVPGFNIFIIESGVYKPPKVFVMDWETERDIDLMVEWYGEYISGNKSMCKRYKSKI